MPSRIDLESHRVDLAFKINNSLKTVNQCRELYNRAMESDDPFHHKTAQTLLYNSCGYYVKVLISLKRVAFDIKYERFDK